MKIRIEQSLNGIFEYDPAKLVIQPQALSVCGAPGEACRGGFRIEGSDGKKVKGFIYSSSPRVICEPVEFQGIQNDIHYQVDLSGFGAGETECGTITVCSDLGEYTVPFEIMVEQQAKTGEPLPVAGIAEFVRLAESDFAKAYRVFSMPEFREMLKAEARGLLGLYDGLMQGAQGYPVLEEFLVGAGFKDKVEISVIRNEPIGRLGEQEAHDSKQEPEGQDVLDWGALTEPVRETITLARSTWGFQIGRAHV